MNLSPFLLSCPFFVLSTIGFLLLFFTSCERKTPPVLFGISLLIQAPLYLSITGCNYMPLPFLISVEYLVGYFGLFLDPIILFAFLSYAFSLNQILKKYWIILLPGLILGTIHLFVFSGYPDEVQKEITFSYWREDNIKKYAGIYTIQGINTIVMRLLRAIYLILYMRILVYNFGRFLRNNLSNHKRVNVSRPILIGVLYFSLCIAYLFSSVLNNYILLLIVIMEICLGFTIFYVINKSFVNMELIQSHFVSFIHSNDKSFIIKYLLPKLSVKQMESSVEELPFDKTELLYQRLIYYFETKKPYLQKNLCLNDIVRGLNSNRTYISQLLTKERNISFYDFVNTYRVKEAKKIIQQQPNLRLSSIAEDCGFCSYTTFMKYFVKKENMSPVAWKNKVLQDMGH